MKRENKQKIETITKAIEWLESSPRITIDYINKSKLNGYGSYDSNISKKYFDAIDTASDISQLIMDKVTKEEIERLTNILNDL